MSIVNCHRTVGGVGVLVVEKSLKKAAQVDPMKHGQDAETSILDRPTSSNLVFCAPSVDGCRYIIIGCIT